MWPTSKFSRVARLSLLIAAALSFLPARAEAVRESQGQALADLAARIITCSVHPCLGDSVKDLRSALHARVVTDGTFYFSDLAVAYPATRGSLTGLVEWDLDDGLEEISFKIVEFEVAPAVLAAELEKTLPGCQMEGDDDEPEDVDDDDFAENERSCLAGGEGDRAVLVDFYSAPGLAILEISR